MEFIKGQQKLTLLDREHQLKIAQSDMNEKSLLSKFEELERKSQADRLAFEMENDKRERDHEQYINKIKLDAEKNLRDLDILKDKLRREEDSNRRKDYYDERSYDRKDSSEIIKWLPGIILGAGLLLPKLMS